MPGEGAVSSAGTGGVSRPPVLSDTVDYEQWKKEIAMWQLCCKYSKTQQGPALALSLQDKARDAVLELKLEDISKETGVTLILTTLDGIFLKDVNQRMFVAMKMFEQHTREKGQSLDAYINNFEKHYNRVKAHKIVFPDQFLAYRLLENADLEQSKNELIRTTITALTYDGMKSQLRKLEDVVLNVASSVDNGCRVKTESEEVFYGRFNRNHGRGRGSDRSRGSSRGSRAGSRGGRRHGNCHHCGSPEHWVRECPVLNTNNHERSDDFRNNNNVNFVNNTEDVRLTL